MCAINECLQIIKESRYLLGHISDKMADVTELICDEEAAGGTKTTYKTVTHCEILHTWIKLKRDLTITTCYM